MWEGERVVKHKGADDRQDDRQQQQQQQPATRTKSNSNERPGGGDQVLSSLVSRDYIQAWLCGWDKRGATT